MSERDGPPSASASRPSPTLVDDVKLPTLRRNFRVVVSSEVRRLRSNAQCFSKLSDGTRFAVTRVTGRRTSESLGYAATCLISYLSMAVRGRATPGSGVHPSSESDRASYRPRQFRLAVAPRAGRDCSINGKVSECPMIGANVGNRPIGATGRTPHRDPLRGDPAAYGMLDTSRRDEASPVLRVH